MVNFLVANREKLMQICLEENKNLDLKIFENLFQNIIANNITAAFNIDKKQTVIILSILDANKIKN